MAQVELLLINNDCLLRVTGVRGTNGVYLNGATASVTLLDLTSEDEIAGETWPLSMSWVSGSNGNYEVLLTDSLQLSNNQSVRADIEINGGAGLRLSIRQPVRATYRTGD